VLKDADDEDEHFVDAADDDDDDKDAAAAAATNDDRTKDADMSPAKSSWVHRNNLTCMF